MEQVIPNMRTGTQAGRRRRHLFQERTRTKVRLSSGQRWVREAQKDHSDRENRRGRQEWKATLRSLVA